jgi:hypothetical protein
MLASAPTSTPAAIPPEKATFLLECHLADSDTGKMMI